MARSFFVLSGLTLLMSGWIVFGVPDHADAAHHEHLSDQIAGDLASTGQPRILAFCSSLFFSCRRIYGCQSLWSSAWMIHVNGFSRSLTADYLAAMSMAMIVSYALIGLLSTGLARRGIMPIYLLGSGLMLALLTLLLIITEAVEQNYLLWIAYGVFSSCGTVVYSSAATRFPIALSGRVTTSLNLLVFAGAFSLQWGLGILIEALQAIGIAIFSLTTAPLFFCLHCRPPCSSGCSSAAINAHDAH